MALPDAVLRNLDLLRCPRSGAPLKPVSLPAGGALESPAGRWPVVEGIAVFRDGPEPQQALSLLEEAREPEAAALLAATAFRSRKDRIQERFEQWVLRRPAGSGPASRRTARRLEGAVPGAFAEAVQELFGRPPWPVPATATYFLNRRSDPSFVAAEALALQALPPDGPVLDVGCGVGHMLASLEAADREPMVGMDDLFAALLLARRYLAGSALLVCADAGHRLPLADGAFRGLVSVDAFFDLSSLPGAAREFRRVLHPSGRVLIPHLHNRLVPHLYAGRCPLTPAEYLEVLDPLDAALLDEREVLAAVLGEGPFRLRPVRTPASLEHAADLMAVAGLDEIAGEGPILPAPVGPWTVNPLYDRKPGAEEADRVVLARGSHRYISEEESGAYAGLLPQEASVAAELLDRLPAAVAPFEMPSELLAARVILPLPPVMGRPESAGATEAPEPPATRPRRGGPVRAARELRSAVRSGSLARRVDDEAREGLPDGALAILMAHRVSRVRGPDPLDLTVPAPLLDRTLEVLRGGFSFLAFDEAMEALLGGSLPPGLSVTLTFDDGTEDLLAHGTPVLRAHGVRAGVFLCGQRAAPGGRFWWDGPGGGGRPADPRAFLGLDDVYVLGHHGQGHRALEKLGPDERRRELEPLPVGTGPWLAYPFGRPEDADVLAARSAREAGFRAALTTRMGLARPGDDPFLLPRVALHDGPVDGLLARLVRLVERAGHAP